MLITPELVLSWEPCNDYDDLRLAELLGDGKTPLEIIEQYPSIPVPGHDILWLLLRPEIVPGRDLHLLVCDYAEAVLGIYERQYPGDLRPRGALEIKRRWVGGNATNRELDAARDAAWVTAGDAARAAAGAAAGAAARAAAGAAAWATAWATAGDAAVAASGAAAQATALATAWVTAGAAARDAALAAARAATYKRQIAQLRAVIAEEEDKS